MDNSKPRVTTFTKSLKLLGDFWSLRIIESLVAGAQRFCEIQRTIDNVNPATLTKKLTDLEKAKLIVRTEEAGGNTVHYELSPLGKDTVPVLKAINDFSKKYEEQQK
jgi:DNA-binding HxlR family transcriptional regulator